MFGLRNPEYPGETAPDDETLGHRVLGESTALYRRSGIDRGFSCPFTLLADCCELGEPSCALVDRYETEPRPGVFGPPIFDSNCLS